MSCTLLVVGINGIKSGTRKVTILCKPGANDSQMASDGLKNPGLHETFG